MNRKYGIVFGAVLVTLLMVSSATAVTMQSNENDTSTKGIKNNVLKNLLLKYYKIDMDKTTMGEFEQILYGLIPKTSLKKPELVAQLKKDVDDLCVALDQIGVTPDMTIAQAKTIIDDNPEPLIALGFNLFCTIDVQGVGSTFPMLRIVKVIWGTWGVMYDAGSTHAVIEGLLGRQSATNVGCGGNLIGMIGMMSCLGRANFGPVPLPVASVYGWFVLYSRSSVPFV